MHDLSAKVQNTIGLKRATIPIKGSTRKQGLVFLTMRHAFNDCLDNMWLAFLEFKYAQFAPTENYCMILLIKKTWPQPSKLSYTTLVYNDKL